MPSRAIDRCPWREIGPDGHRDLGSPFDAPNYFDLRIHTGGLEVIPQPFISPSPSSFVFHPPRNHPMKIGKIDRLPYSWLTRQSIESVRDICCYIFSSRRLYSICSFKSFWRWSRTQSSGWQLEEVMNEYSVKVLLHQTNTGELRFPKRA